LTRERFSSIELAHNKAWVKIIAGATLTRERFSSIELAHNKAWVKIIAGATLTRERFSSIELAHNKAWMREDYRRCNLDQGAFLEYRACAKQSMDA